MISCGNGIALSEIHDLINTNEGLDIKNSEVKLFLEEFFENSVQLSSLDITDVINILHSPDGVNAAAELSGASF